MKNNLKRLVDYGGVPVGIAEEVREHVHVDVDTGGAERRHNCQNVVRSPARHKCSKIIQLPDGDTIQFKTMCSNKHKLI